MEIFYSWQSHEKNKLLLTKTGKIMKLFTFFFFVATLQLSAKGYSQNVNLTASNITLKKAFRHIGEQTGYSFFINHKLLKDAGTVNLSLKGATITEALQACLKDQHIAYVIIDKTVILKAKKDIDGLPSKLSPPSRLLTGTVTDSAAKNPLAGVTIQVRGTTTGTTTDANGNFSLQVPDDAVLIVSFLGYGRKEIPVNGKNAINITLAATTTGLNQLVVVGYGTKEKKNLTGAISTVTSEVFQSRPTTNVISALQGEVPGILIQRSSGLPGAEGYNLTLRGYSSTNGGNSPLVLIDGIPGNLDLLNPDDIESVTVLKDASASIYGARAANGVLLVTTKNGHKGPPIISYSSNIAITKLEGMMKSPTNYQLAIMDNEATIHNGAAPMYTPQMLQKILNNDPNPIPHPLYSGWMLFFTNTDWFKALFENGFEQKHNLSITGGGDNSNYYLSANYSDLQGVVKYANDNNKRYSLRLNYNYDLSKHIRLESEVSFENQIRNNIGGIGSWVITEGIFGMPNHPVYSKDGKFFAQGGWGNAVAEAKEGGPLVFNTKNLNGNFRLITDIVQGLKLTLQAGLRYGSENDKDVAKAVPLYNWEGDLAYYAIANPDQASVELMNSRTNYKNFTGYLEYKKTFNDYHDFNVMVGASHEENDYNWFSARRDNFVTDEVWSLNLGGTDNMSNDGGGNQWAISSFFSRVGYSYKNKYLLEGILRYDGSSRFNKNNRWGLFPGLSAAWRLSQEGFLKNSRLFEDLKLRASYGQTGNQEGIGLYDYLQLINIEPLYSTFGAGRKIQSASLSGMVALNRTWETLVNRNIGIDATMLHSRFNVTFDYFIKTNKNLLIPITYPSMLGAIPPYSNSGKLKTWGFETSLEYKYHIGKVSFSTKLILSDAQNKIISYGGEDTYVVGLNRIRQGYPINTYFAYVFDGLIRNKKELDEYKKLGGVPNNIQIGDARFKDVNGDGTISAYSNKPGSDGDLVNAGSLTPRYNFGLNLTAQYKNFDFGIFLQGIGKRTVFREGEYAIPFSDWWRQPPAFYYKKTWNEDRPNAAYPELSHGSIRYWNYQPSTLTKINGAYIRVKNLQIGYSFPQRLIKKISIEKARIYFSGEDLWELDGVKGGWDPESSTSGFNYPFQRYYSVGINVTFKSK